VEHDLGVGLREHFDPKARWRSAIASARAIHRLGSFGRVSTKSSGSSGSGGWMNDSAEDVSTMAKETKEDPGSNEHVKVIAPDEEPEGTSSGENKTPPPAPTGAHELKREDEAPPPAHHESAVPAPVVHALAKGTAKAANGNTKDTGKAHQDDDVLSMPGSFDMSGSPPRHHHQGHTWGDLWRRFRIG